MKDGHFGLQRLARNKKEDPDDVSLLDGAGLFPPDEEYNNYVRNVVAYSDEVCPNSNCASRDHPN
jgi:hypothetical protein